MRVLGIQNNNCNTTFKAGNIMLEGIEPKEFQDLQSYKDIKYITETDELDLTITKNEDKNASHFMICSQKEAPNSAKVIRGASCVDIARGSSPQDVSYILYQKVIRSVERLALRMQEATGQRTEFLKYLKR